MKTASLRFSIPCGLLFVIFAAAVHAQAQNPQEFLEYDGIDSQVLWATPGPSHFPTLASSDIIGHKGVSFTGLFDYYFQPATLKTQNNDNERWVVENALVADFLWGFGLFDWVQIGVTLPVALHQNGEGAQAGVHEGDAGEDADLMLSSSSLRDLRLNIKTRLLGGFAAHPDRRDWGLALDVGMTVPTGDEWGFAGDKSVVFFPTAILDFHRCKFSAALNLGARLRVESAEWQYLENYGTKTTPQTGTLVNYEVSHQGMFGLGATGHFLDRRLLLSAETQGLIALDGFDRFGMEFRGGAGFMPDQARAITIWLSGGSSVGTGDLVGMPIARILLGVTYAPGSGESEATLETATSSMNPGSLL